MARNPAPLSVQFWVKESVAVEFSSLIVAIFEGISEEYTWRVSSLSATHFTVEKAEFWVIRSDWQKMFLLYNF